MDNNQPKKKKAGLIALIAMLLVITTLASCIGLYAWAKYITNKNGQASVDVARWNFNLSLRAGQNTVTLPTQTLDLATTTYQNLANDRIAPGTSGEFDIVINTTGTEVSLNYVVTIAISECPRNITFSRQQGSDTSTLETVSAGGTNSYTRTITFNKNVPVENASGEFVEKIKWNWPYESGNDQWDTADNGKTTTLAITVVGTEVQPEVLAANSVQALAQSGAIQRWDTINYNPGNGTTASINLPKGASIETSKLAAINLPAGASLDNTITASEATDWVVLDVNQTTGEVLIMPRNVPQVNLTLEGKDGYNNAIEALNAVAGIYLNPTYANSARSLTIEDVNKVEGNIPNAEVEERTFKHRYGMNPTTLEITDTGSNSNTPEQTYTKTETTGFYEAKASSFNGTGWLASRGVSMWDFNNSDYITFQVWRFSGGRAGGCPRLFDIIHEYQRDYDADTSYGSGADLVVPVVSLKSNIQLNSSSEFYTETATATTPVQGETAYVHHNWTIQ